MSKQIQKFEEKYRNGPTKFIESLIEIQKGQKKSCWSWWIWPTNYKQGASANSKEWALEDEEAIEFIHHYYLRGCWLQMMNAVADQLDKEINSNMNAPEEAIKYLCGIDVSRIGSTCRLFARITNYSDIQVNNVCRRINGLYKIFDRKKMNRNDYDKLMKEEKGSIVVPPKGNADLRNPEKITPCDKEFQITRKSDDLLSHKGNLFIELVNRIISRLL